MNFDFLEELLLLEFGYDNFNNPSTLLFGKIGFVLNHVTNSGTSPNSHFNSVFL